jgi:anti-sigma regulatory factor (Ser/Thr protein kinase)
MAVTETECAAEAFAALTFGQRAEEMVWRRAFAGTPESAHDARAFVRCLLACSPGRDDVVQAAGELIANAITHTRSGAPGGIYVVEVRRRRRGVALAVVDQGGPEEPRAHDGEYADPGEHGYGLMTVGALASWWDWRGDERGRRVSALFERDRS